MPHSRYLWIAFFTAVVAAGLFGAGVAHVSGQESVYPVDDNPLADESAIEEFRKNGSTDGNLSAIDVGFAVAEQHDDVELEGYYTDVNKVFLCVEYREDIERTLQFSLPGEYVRPRPGNLESLTSDHLAHFSPTENGSTSITVHFTGSDRACFAFTKAAGYYFGVREDFDSWINNTTGIDLPSFSSEADWRHVPSDAFVNDSSHELDTRGQEMTIQFDADRSRSTRWLLVPDCSDPAEQDICKYRNPAANATNSSNATITLMSVEDTPPPVRYRYGASAQTGIMAGLRDVAGAFDAFLADVGKALGGLLGGGS